MDILLTNKHLRAQAICFLLLFKGIYGLSQTLSGVVTDQKTGEAVVGAYLSFEQESRTVGWCLSSDNGLFTVSCIAQPERVHVSMMGYAPLTEPVTGDILSLSLTPRQTMLSPSLIRSAPLEEKGDTLIYSPNAFARGGERTARDILQNLPEIRISEGGGVLYNGNFINRFYVDGLDLMGARYGVVTNNLPAGQIARIEVYRNHQPVRALEGTAATGRAAVNIVLKESKRNTWLFSGDAGLGLPEFPRFDARMMFTRFSSASQALYLVKGNNAGKDILSEIRMQSYFGRPGAYLIQEGTLDEDFVSAITPRRQTPDLPREFWLDNLSGFATINHLSRLSDRFQGRFSLLVAAQRQASSQHTQERVRLVDDAVISLEEQQESLVKKWNYSGSYELERNDSAFYFNNRLSVDGEIGGEDVCITASQPVREQYHLPSWKISNFANATWQGRFGPVSFHSDTRLIGGAHAAEFVVGENRFAQDFHRTTLRSSNVLSWNAGRGDWRLSVRPGIDMNGAWINRPDFGAFGIKPGITTRFTWHPGALQLDLRLPVEGIFLVSSGKEPSSYSGVNLHPVLQGTISLSKFFSAITRIEGGLAHSDVMDLYTVPFRKSWIDICSAQGFSSRKTFGTSAQMRYANHARLFYLDAGGGYNLLSMDRTAVSDYNPSLRQTGYANHPSMAESLLFSLDAKKYIGTNQWTIEAGMDGLREKSELFLQGIATAYLTNRMSYHISLTARPAKWLSFMGSTSLTRTTVTGESNGNVSTLTWNGDILVNPVSPLQIQCSCRFRNDLIGTFQNRDKPLIGLSFTWKFPKLDLYFTGDNLLDATSVTRVELDRFSTWTRTWKLLGRRLMAGIRMSM